MTSTNSSNNFLAALKNNFRQYAALFAVFQIFALLLSVLLVNFNADYFDGRNQLTNNITEAFSNMCIPLFVCFFSVEAFILAAVLFRGIYSKRASDFYFSLPVKRGSWFNANFLFGVISMALSYAMFYIISMITVNFGSFKAFRFVNLEAGSFLKFTVMSFAAVTVLYTVFVMCAVIAGRIWQYVFLSFISTLVLYIGAIGFICYLNTIYGFWLNLEASYSIAAVKLVISDVTDFSVLKFAIAAVAQFAVFYTAGYFAFKKRKAEVAENRLSGKALPVALTVICFLAETFVCLGIGNEVSLFARILAAIIIVAVTAVVLSAVFFRKAMSKPVFASLFCAIMFSAATIISVQLISEKIYVNVLPETDEIESVTVRSYSNDGSTSVIDILCGYSYIELSDSFEKNISFNRDEYKFSTEEAKEKTVQFQQKILSDETRDNIYSEEYYNGSVSFSIEYKFQNGKTIKRFYSVSTKDIVDEYIDLLKTDEGIDQLGIIEFKPKDILFVTADDVSWDEDYNGSVQIDYPKSIIYDDVVFIKDIDIRKLCECIIKDLKNANPYRFVDTAGIYFDTGYQYDKDTDEWYKNSIYSKYDFELGLYQFNESIDNVSREQLERLSPKEMLVANDKHGLQGNSHKEWVKSFYFYINTDEDINTVSYLKELGYKF